MYIAAHPDDQNTRMISYLSNNIKAETAYLSLTRGDGGWVMGRKASGIVCGAVAAAMVTHFATRGESEVDIQIA